ncbi:MULTISPECIES: hypothetical protein [unclassified Sphingomonas]|uniref:hypothetical protein n=1 Tax=unclassified Sphingomonas TaxID=196159 RepID=UPI000AD4BE64|nr:MULTISPECIES: hypothetical protein [unclassified Sphingomonas]
MASLVANLVAGALPRLGLDPSTAGGFESWLSSATIVPTHALDSSSQRFDVGDLDSLVSFLSFDFERFSLAAAESFLRATEVPTGALNHAGWRLLELYYSAFFAAHAITRSQGAGVASITAATARRVSEIASLYDSAAAPFEPGMWFYRVRAGDDGTYVEFRQATTGSGVHDAFWREFCGFMQALAADAVQSGLPDSAQFLAGAEEIAINIRTGGVGSGSWLAKIRNEINYKHAHDTWYPEPRRQVATSALSEIRLKPSESIRLDRSKSKEPLSAFANTCGYLTALSFELSDYIAARSTKGAAFGQKWRRFADLTKLVMPG